MASNSTPLPTSGTRPISSNAASQEIDQSDTIATPEGDGEFDPSEPVHPLRDGSLEDPNGAEPLSYRRDHK